MVVILGVGEAWGPSPVSFSYLTASAWWQRVQLPYTILATTFSGTTWTLPIDRSSACVRAYRVTCVDTQHQQLLVLACKEKKKEWSFDSIKLSETDTIDGH
jgi:hypothetical protein